MSAWNSNGLTVRIATATGDTIALTDDVVIYTNSAAKGAAITGVSDARVQLGKVYHFVNANTGAVTITPASGTIDGAATKVLVAGTAAAPTTLRIINDGTMWRSISATP
jgi:hypothetical protein